MVSRFDFNNIENEKRNNKSSNGKSAPKSDNSDKKSGKLNTQNNKSSKDLGNNEKEKIKSFIKPKKNEFSFRIILFFVLIIAVAYLIFCVVKVINNKNISTYQVKEGALTEQNSYTGLILREEQTYESTASGYYNYYLKEGEKASYTDLVYTVDGSGKIKEMMANQTGDASTLSKDDLNEIKSEIVKFSKEYDNKEFEDVYEFKTDLDDISLKMSNLYVLNQITTMSLNGTNVVKNYCCDGNKSAKTGYVVYYKDGYEELKPEDIDRTYFAKDRNEDKEIIANNEMIDVGDFAYKLVTSNTWQLVFLLDSEEKAEEYNNKEIKVKFSKDQAVLKGKLTVLDALSPEKNQSTDKIGVITFNTSVADYLNNRYIDFEIISDENSGYKVPISSIAQKEFLLIPKDIAFDYNNITNTVNVKLDIYLEDGTRSFVTQSINVYEIDDTDYYVDTEILSLGNMIYGENTDNSYKINRAGSLIGVYRINQGYADFKKVKKLYENDEYCIIEPETTTIKPYDYIALDASKIKDNEYIYE